VSDSEIVPWMPVAKRTALIKESEAWQAIAKQAEAFTVVDDATAAHAAHLVKQAREIWRAKEEERKTITTPLLAAKNATDAYFKPTLEAVARIKRHYEQEIARYDLERERARARVLAESAAQIAQSIVPTEPVPEPVHVEKTSIRHRWEPEIVDPDLVPRALCSPDLAKIRERVWYADTAHKEPHPIPGVKFVLKSTVVAR
jgi:hypothetical protein